ncbi:hypothetical protein [Branchiibius sp. NY16-3462-2]|uniref:hypothetical protein n=1 Tax=Branchiibius sp. NY16-3462-2 TaxID=1807500 RepID=UPI00079A3E68|nr:hypothetical protein [Branchiibius sp. NY16-3462-2]KYH45000.1 hypothetical protein AZH51_14000 [Branchiibius sp. NY16-3462-2]
MSEVDTHHRFAGIPGEPRQAPPVSAGFCTSAGGSQSVAADTAGLRTAADLLDRSGDVARDTWGGLTAAMLRMPAAGTIMSPGSAADIACQVAALTMGPTGLGALVLRTEALARLVRIAADLYDANEVLARQLMLRLQEALLPVKLPYELAGTAINFGARHLGSDHDVIPGTEGLTGDLTLLLHTTLNPAGLEVLSTEQQLAAMVWAGELFGLFQDSTPLTVNQISSRTPNGAGPKDLGGLVDDINVAGRSPSDRERILVRHIQQPDGTGAWVVAIPGTAQWSPVSQSNPADVTGDLRLMAGMSSSLKPAVQQALSAAQRQAGVKPGSEPVLLTGHSEGGIVAASIGRDPQLAKEMNVREVVTFASPVTGMDLPAQVNGLDIGIRGDVVHHGDNQDTANRINRAQISCDAPTDAANNFATHDSHGYATRAHELLGHDTEVIAARDFYQRADGVFLGGTATTYTFELQRPGPAPAPPKPPPPKPAQPQLWNPPPVLPPR